MVGGTRSQYFRIVGVIAALAGTQALHPAFAEAQARGTLQVSAQVVDPRPSSDGLQLAKAALASASSNSPSGEHETVSTLAHVSITYATERRSALVVTIDYSHN